MSVNIELVKCYGNVFRKVRIYKDGDLIKEFVPKKMSEHEICRALEFVYCLNLEHSKKEIDIEDKDYAKICK